MEEIPQATEEPRLLRSTYRRQQQTNVHFLRPAYRMRRDEYEGVLDLGPFSEGPSSDPPRFQKKGSDSPTEHQPDLRKDGEGINSLLGDRENDSSTPLRTPPSEDISHDSSSCGDHAPPPWSQARFKLNHPFLPGASPLSPFSPHSSRDGARPASGSPPSLYSPDPASPGHGSGDQRKSCEYCRFRKKKCSGHNTCVRCVRVGIDCVYMPDLIAKRIADGLLDISPPSLGSCFPCHAPATSSRPDGDPVEISTQPSVRGAKRRKRAANGKPGATKRQKKLRAVQDPTRSVTSNIDQPIPRDNDPNSGDPGSAYVELALNLAGRVFGIAAGDIWDTEPRCVNFDMVDRSILVLSVPKHRNISGPGEGFGDTTAAQPEYKDDSVHTSQPASITTVGWIPHPETSSLDVGCISAEAIPTSGFNIFPLPATAPSLGPFVEPSMLSPPPPSAPPPSSADASSDHDPAESWTMDDWSAWYDSTFLSR
jgi:hypothetical protein